jgi:two-component system, probable response regulator PhcQ
MKASILLVDDEPHVLAALQRVLRLPLRDLARVELFSDPRLALARVREHAFDVVVSDFRMPQQDGVAFLREVREVQPRAVPMIVSGSADVATLVRAVNDAQVFRYILKPWSDGELVGSVKAALAHAQASKEEALLADAMRVREGRLPALEAERRRLESEEPGLTHVDWGPNGEVLMPPLS